VKGRQVSDTVGVSNGSHPASQPQPKSKSSRPQDHWVKAGFHQATLGLAILDGGGNHVLVNAAYIQQTGRPKSNLIGLPITDVVGAPSRQRLADWARSPQQPTTLEVTIDRRGQGDYDAAMFLTPMDDRDANMHVLVQLVGVDSSPTARDSAARLRAVVEHIDELVLMTRADGAITYVSPSAEQALGQTAAELLGTQLTELIHPEDTETMHGVARSGRSSAVDVSVRIRHHEYGWIPHDCRISEVRDQLGRLLGLAYLARPSREHDETSPQGELTDAPGKEIDQSVPGPTVVPSPIVTDTSDLIWQFDHEGPIFANPAARAMVGLGPDDSLEDLGLGDIHPKWSVERIAKHGVPQTLAGIVWEDDLSLLDQNGDEIPVSYVLAGHRDETDLVTRWSSISRPLDRALRTEAEIRWAATHDPLTALPGRVLLLDRIEVALARATRTGQRVGLLLLDLDFFETLNSSVGTDIAERLLQTTAERLRSAIRPGDTVGRMGEDEFVVLCEHFDQLDDAERFAERLLRVVEDPIELDGAEWFVSMSVGVALARQGITTPDGMIRNANSAMYRAKELGRGRHVVFGNTLAAPELPFPGTPGAGESAGT